MGVYEELIRARNPSFYFPCAEGSSTVEPRDFSLNNRTGAYNTAIYPLRTVPGPSPVLPFAFRTNSNSTPTLNSPSATHWAGTGSVDLWFKSVGGVSSGRRLAARGDQSAGFGNRSWDIATGAGAVMYVGLFVGGARTEHFGTEVLVADVWYHFGFTYDGSNVRFYLNGNLDLQAGKTGGLNNPTIVTTVGRIINGSAVAQTIDVCHFATYAGQVLRQDEMSRRYSVGMTGRPVRMRALR